MLFEVLRRGEKEEKEKSGKDGMDLGSPPTRPRDSAELILLLAIVLVLRCWCALSLYYYCISLYYRSRVNIVLLSFLQHCLRLPQLGYMAVPMRRFSTRTLLQAKPPLLSARSPLPLPLFLSAPRSAPALRPTATPRLRPRSPLSHTTKRYCSYRRMCGSRRGEVSGSTNVQGREVLPTNVKPLHYDLTLEPNFEKFTYDGTVVIEYAT